MRVLMVSSLWPPVALGGAELYAARLADELRGRDHDVGVLTLGVDDADVVARVRPWPYRLDSWASQPRWKRAVFHAVDLHRPATVRRLGAAVEDFAPDVVHSHAVQGLSTAALTVPAALGRPHVHSLHDYWLLCQRTTLRHGSGRRCRRCSPCGLISVLRRRALARSGPDVYLAPSEAVVREHEADPHIRQRVRLVHHPVDRLWHRNRPAHRSELTFGYLGQLTAVKGVRTLLDAFVSFTASEGLATGGHRLLVAGAGPLAAELDRHVGAGVRALGWLDAAARERFYDAINCLVVPSEWNEPAGLVVAEAAARGVPVIGAAIGGIPEYVAASSRPLLFRPGDAGDLRSSMTRFAERPVGGGVVSVDHLPTWGEHTTRVLDAYADAGACATTTRLRR